MNLARLLPERIEALLAPDGLQLYRHGVTATVDLVADPDTELWRPALLALDDALAARPARHAARSTNSTNGTNDATTGRLPKLLDGLLAPQLDIVLSEHFTHWQLLPWEAEAETVAEQEALARHHFREVFGDSARHWQVRCLTTPPGRAMPTCAIDDALLAALRQLAVTHGCRLGRVRPLLAAATEHWQRKIPRGITWFVLLEAGRLNLGLLTNRRWSALRSEPLPASMDLGEQLAGVITRSALAGGITLGTGQLLLCGEGADTCPVALTGLTVQRLGSALAWTGQAAVQRQDKPFQ